MEREKLDFLKTHQSTLKELTDLKLRHEQTAGMVSEIESLKRSISNYAGRFEKLTEYNQKSVEDLLASGDSSFECRRDSYQDECICGAKLHKNVQAFLLEKKEALRAYRPVVAESREVKARGENSEMVVERDNLIKELQETIHQLTQEANKYKVQKVRGG